MTTLSTLRSLFGLAFCAIPFASCVLAGPPREGNSGKGGWEATITTDDGSYLSVYCFLPDGVLVEVQKYPGRDGTIAFAFYEQADGKLSYTIIDHTDAAQKGSTLEFKRIAFNDKEYGGMLELAKVLNQLKIKELNEQRLIDVY